jgi:hypothetical protein
MSAYGISAPALCRACPLVCSQSGVWHLDARYSFFNRHLELGHGTEPTALAGERNAAHLIHIDSARYMHESLVTTNGFVCVCVCVCVCVRVRARVCVWCMQRGISEGCREPSSQSGKVCTRRGELTVHHPTTARYITVRLHCTLHKWCAVYVYTRFTPS